MGRQSQAFARTAVRNTIFLPRRILLAPATKFDQFFYENNQLREEIFAEDMGTAKHNRNKTS